MARIFNNQVHKNQFLKTVIFENLNLLNLTHYKHWEQVFCNQNKHTSSVILKLVTIK